MTVFAILLLALTRAEIIERMRTPPITMVQGLVSVYADCDAEQRREYQQPVAAFAAQICRTMYAGAAVREKRFHDPGIVIHLGNGRDGATNVVSQVIERADGTGAMRIKLPSPGSSDMAALRAAVARGFCLAVQGEDISEAAAVRRLLDADPALRAQGALERLDKWRAEGELPPGATDEDMLKIMRTVHLPGDVLRQELCVFAARLNLYPNTYRFPFVGRFHELSFREAITLREIDPRIRLAAFAKITELKVYGGGHGEAMDRLVDGYCDFLKDLAMGKDNRSELVLKLDELERQLKELAK